VKAEKLDVYASPRRAEPARSTCPRIHLHHPKYIPIRILKVRQPPNPGNRHLGHAQHGRATLRLGHGRIQILDIHRNHERVRRRHRPRRRPWPRQQSAVDARLAIRPGIDHPVFPSRELAERPAEQTRIEINQRLRIRGVDFEMHCT
jgi:hypothetical protein